MNSKKSGRSQRFFRALLRLLPFDFRWEYGEEMEEVFEQQRKEVETGKGKAGMMKLWWKTVAGIFSVAPREHWDMFRQDVRYALRMMGKNPGFTSIAVITLGLGIGANTAIFSMVNGVLLRPLPYEGGENLVVLRQKAPRAGVANMGFSVKEVLDYREQNQTLEAIVEYHSMSFILLGRDEPERVQTGVVSAEFFDVLKIDPVLGRTFLPGEDAHDAEPVLIMSYEYWQRSHGGDRNIIGQAFEMNDRMHTVIGVLPPVPQFPNENDVYMATSSCPFRSAQPFIDNRNARMMQVFAKRKTGTRLEQAQADLSTVASRLQQEYPESYPETQGYAIASTALEQELTQQARPTLLILLGTVGFVLLIACANVANLTLSRFLRRGKEMAVRAALGAGRSRILRQLLTESLLLSLLGGVVGLVLAWYGLDLLITFTARFTTRASEISIDGTVLAFTLAVSVGIGILFGMIPAFRSRSNLAVDLNEGSSRSSAGTGSHRLRSLLLVAQVAVSLMLLIGAGLMVRSLIRLQQVDPGVNTERILTMFVDLNWSKHPGTNLQTRRDFHHALLERVRALPGVVSADMSRTFPLNSAGTFALNFQIEGRPIEEGQPLPRFDFRSAGPDYFPTVGVPLVRGRLFERGDDAEAPLVVLVNQSLARRHFGEDNPIGQNISYDSGQTWRRIVGVVGNVRQYGLDQDVPDEIYMPNDQVPLRSMSLLVKTQADPMGLARSITEAVYAIDPEQPVARIATMEEIRRTSLAPARLTTGLIGLFALLALVITAAGIGGVMALMVSQRIHEIGIRMALGATPGQILRMVAGQGLALVGIGLVLGIMGAFALTRFVSGLLFQTEPTDPVTFMVVPVVLLLVAAAACLVPARRATRVDPLVALRYE